VHEDLIRTFGLEGRVAVVTGGGSGIGRGTALVLAQAGARVLVADIDEKGIAETVAQVKAAGSQAVGRRVDVARREEVDALADAAVQAWGRLDVWVSSAGVIVRKPILEMSEQDVEFQIGVNMKGVYWGCAAAARVMKERGGGSIINISSTGADSVPAGVSVYAMTKGAVNVCTRACAREFGPHGIRVNAIGPGFIYTPLTTAAHENDPVRRDAYLKAMAQPSPLGIIGEPRDIALAVLYLASDASRFVTGQVLRPNGGVSMV
jgi:3-oxoacyl-[acyl-carrier protein] reductase